MEAVLVLGAVGLCLYLVLRLVLGTRERGASRSDGGRWQVHHYDKDANTRVVVREMSPGGTHLLNEHVVAEIPIGEPDYDQRFLAAMSTARERRALFEAEDG